MKDQIRIITDDCTWLKCYKNFNVLYELGYAIACSKRSILINNQSLAGDDRADNRLPLLDTIGYRPYLSGTELVKHLQDVDLRVPPLWKPRNLDRTQPVYYLRTPAPVAFDIRTLSRLKKTRLGFRVHDPEESGPLSAAEAIDHVAQSCGVIVHLLSSVYRNYRAHNLCMAFVAGLAHGSRKETLILQAGTEPVPLDYRDFVSRWTTEDLIDQLVGDFAPAIYELVQDHRHNTHISPETKLQQVNIGSSAAENELSELHNYFLETDEFRRIERGEIQVATGRKGSGKTALFSQVRNRKRHNRQNVVLDLQPEGSQLLKIKDIMLQMMHKGTKEHTVVAFWEYLLLLEVCHKMLHKDKQVHITNHQLFGPYHALEMAYIGHETARAGDFAERMLALVDVVCEEFQRYFEGAHSTVTLSQQKLTQLLYRHDIHELRQRLTEYLRHKGELWILFDNLDKGWPPYGIEPDDILLLRCLQDALAKVQRQLEREGIDCRSTLFLRNDVLSMMVDQTPDRGKMSVVAIDWDDQDMLRELLRRRLQHSLGLDPEMRFEDLWGQVCISHYANEETSQYLIDRSLMRPRSMIDLVQRCLSHAVNVGHERIEADDIEHGERSYSASLVDQIGYEIRDVFAGGDDLLYALIGASVIMSEEDVRQHLIEGGVDKSLMAQAIKMLHWYGVLGILRHESAEPEFIYGVAYDMKRLETLARRARSNGGLLLCVNPGFAKGLDISE